MAKSSGKRIAAVVVILLVLVGVVGGVFYWQGSQDVPGQWYVFASGPDLAEPLRIEINVYDDAEESKEKMRDQVAQLAQSFTSNPDDERELGRYYFSDRETGELNDYPYVVLSNPGDPDYMFILAKDITDKQEIKKLIKIEDVADLQKHLSANMLNMLDNAEDSRQKGTLKR